MNERNKKQEKRRKARSHVAIRVIATSKEEMGPGSEHMDSLRHLPYEVKTLMNAQAYIKKSEYDDAMEFLARVLYLNGEHIKALSRKAFILGERGDISELWR